MPPVLSAILAMVLYLANSTYLVQRFLSRHAPSLPVICALGLLAATCHGLALYSQLLSPQGLWLSFFNAASLISLFIVLLVLACMKRLAVNLMLAPFQILAILAIAGTVLVNGNAHIQPINEDAGVLAHILLSILAYGVISMAVLQSVMLLFQEQQLRKRPVSTWVHSFPPLQSMESLLFSLLWGGWGLLSLSQDLLFLSGLADFWPAALGALASGLARAQGHPSDAGRFLPVNAGLLWQQTGS